MKAVFLTRYGSPDHLESREIEKPVPGEDEVLVKVHASSVNSWDWDLLNGIPYANRVMFGLQKPKNLIMGCDITGRGWIGYFCSSDCQIIRGRSDMRGSAHEIRHAALHWGRPFH